MDEVSGINHNGDWIYGSSTDQYFSPKSRSNYVDSWRAKSATFFSNKKLADQHFDQGVGNMVAAANATVVDGLARLETALEGDAVANTAAPTSGNSASRSVQKSKSTGAGFSVTFVFEGLGEHHRAKLVDKKALLNRHWIEFTDATGKVTFAGRQPGSYQLWLDNKSKVWEGSLGTDSTITVRSQ